MNPSKLAALLAPLLAWAWSAQVQAQPDAAQDCPPASPSMSPRPPEYPEEMKGKPAPGPLVLVLSLDRCGRVTDVQVEKSTGLRAFDQSGIEAAKTWRLTPELKDGKPVPSRARVPVQFLDDSSGAAEAASVPPPAGASRGLAKMPSEAEMYAGWQRMQVPKVARNADGTVPGYLPDPRPMQGGFGENLERLKRTQRLESQERGVDRYVSDDIFDISVWDVYERDFVFSPAIVRLRLVGDGEKAFWVTSSICEAQPPQGDCAKLDEFLRVSAKPQTPRPPPPNPPAREPSTRKSPSQKPAGKR